jgi:hypothetical protein
MEEEIICLFNACGVDGDLAAAKSAVAAGVEADALDCEEGCNGWQPIHVACGFGHVDIAEWLVEEHCVAVNAQDDRGMQPIHYACDKSHLHIVKWLVKEKGASLDARNNIGVTPLHIACAKGHLAMVEWIVQQDSELVALRTNKHGLKPGYGDATPLQWANLRGHKAVVAYFRTTPYYVRAEKEKAKAAEEKAKARAEATTRADAMMAQLILEEEGAQGMVTKKKKKKSKKKPAQLKAYPPPENSAQPLP